MFQELTSNPMFGLIVSIGMYLLALEIFKRWPLPIFNPLLLATVLVIFLLKMGKIPYKDYYEGGSMLNVLITPATVALGIPLYNTFHLLKHHARSIVVGIVFGSFVNIFLTGILGLIFKLDHDILASILPKSVTTAIAIGISEKMGGVATVTLVIVIATGIIGSIIGPPILKLLKVEEPVARGVALGSSAHAIGTAKAMEYGRVEGAMSGLAIGVTGVVTVFLAPILLNLLGHWFM